MSIDINHRADLKKSGLRYDTIAMMQEPDEERRKLGYLQSMQFTWDRAFERWESLVVARELAHV